MQIVVASTFVPFIRGGGTAIVDDLAEALRERGHRVDTVLLPFWPAYDEMVQQMLALRLLDLTGAGNRLIAIRTPSYLIRHPHKVVWFIHHHRGAYDLWGTRFQDIPGTPEGLRTREAIVESDNASLREATQVFANSKVVAERLRRFNGIDAPVLYPPLADARGYRSEDAERYVFCPSRITPIKRQHLLIESMRHVTSGTRLVVAGSPDAPEHLNELEALVRKHDLGDRVTIIGRWISDEEKQDLFARALACAYVPYDEDSYGYVTLESFHSRKPVITCEDSGGTLELVEDGVTGRVVPPDPIALAEAIEWLADDRARAAGLGRAGYERVLSLSISWDRVVECLVR